MESAKVMWIIAYHAINKPIDRILYQIAPVSIDIMRTTIKYVNLVPFSVRLVLYTIYVQHALVNSVIQHQYVLVRMVTIRLITDIALFVTQRIAQHVKPMIKSA